MFTYLKSVLTSKCPRCHEGELFTHPWYQIRNNTKLHERCAVCGQRTQLEPGFYHGTGYVSYALTVGFSITSFVIFYLISGIGLRDARIGALDHPKRAQHLHAHQPVGLVLIRHQHLLLLHSPPAQCRRVRWWLRGIRSPRWRSRTPTGNGSRRPWSSWRGCR